MAGAAQVGGFNRPTPANGAPSYYLPGTNVPDPRYAQNQQAYDQTMQASGAKSSALDRGLSSFVGSTSNNPNFSMSFSDPRTNTSYSYTPGGGGGAGGGAGQLEDFDFNAALAKARTAQPGPLAAAQLPERVVGATPADSAAAQAAEFGRAKDRIGKLGRGSLTGLQEAYESRGLGGSNMEGAATQGLLSDLQGQEGEVIRDQSIQNLTRQNQVADRNYAGDINQRSQDIGFTTTTRGQDANYELGRAGMLTPLMSLIAANRRRRLY